MNQEDLNGAKKAISNILGKAELTQGSMYEHKIPYSDVWIIFVKKGLFDDGVFKELNLWVNEHKWKLDDKRKKGYWDIQ